MASSLPLIRIQDAWLLRENISPYLSELWGNGEEPPNSEWTAQKVDQYRKAWRPQERKILRGLVELLGLSFRQNVIDVYVAPYFPTSGDPLIISTAHEPNVFADILTHELIHRLMTDNTTTPHTLRLSPKLECLYGKRPYAELVHIPVNAIHKALYLDILASPELLERNIALNKEYDDTSCIRAWNYVNSHDYKEIIARLRTVYTP